MLARFIDIRSMDLVWRQNKMDKNMLDNFVMENIMGKGSYIIKTESCYMMDSGKEDRNTYFDLPIFYINHPLSYIQTHE